MTLLKSTIPSADKYFDVIRESGIVLDKEERKASIVEQVNQAASLVGGEAIIEEGLLNEVANLIEMPTAVMGGFNAEFLTLPRDVLISVMKKHQRYFPVQRVGATLQGESGTSQVRLLRNQPRSQTLAGRPYCHISSPSATATTSALTPSVRATNTSSARALRMQTSSSAKMSNSNSKNIVPNFRH